MSRSSTALAMIGIVVAGIAGAFLLAMGAAGAHPQIQASPGGGGYGYGKHSPSPSPSRSRTRSASPSPSPSLPVTGAPSAQVAITGLISVASGVALLAVCWIWQARRRER